MANVAVLSIIRPRFQLILDLHSCRILKARTQVNITLGIIGPRAEIKGCCAARFSAILRILHPKGENIWQVCITHPGSSALHTLLRAAEILCLNSCVLKGAVQRRAEYIRPRFQILSNRLR